MRDRLGSGGGLRQQRGRAGHGITSRVSTGRCQGDFQRDLDGFRAAGGILEAGPADARLRLGTAFAWPGLPPCRLRVQHQGSLFFSVPFRRFGLDVQLQGTGDSQWWRKRSTVGGATSADWVDCPEWPERWTPVPTWVFAEFSEAVERRTLRYREMADLEFARPVSGE